MAAVGLLTGALAAGGRPALAADTSPRDVAVVGVAQLSGGSEAWLVNLRTHRRATVHPGDSAFGYTVRRVEAERVVLSRGGREFAVRLGDKAIPAPAPVVTVSTLPRRNAASGIHYRRASETAETGNGPAPASGPPPAPAWSDSSPAENDRSPAAAPGYTNSQSPAAIPGYLPLPVAPDYQSYAVPGADGIPGYAGTLPPGYLGYPSYPGTTPGYPDLTGQYSGFTVPSAPYGVYSAWPRYPVSAPWDVPFMGWQGAYPSGSLPGVAGNPQTWRRQGYGTAGSQQMPAASGGNPQTLRRRAGFGSTGR